MAENDSHFPKDSGKHEKGPINQHKRLALGEKVTGTSGGTEKGDTTKRVGNSPVTY